MITMITQVERRDEKCTITRLYSVKHYIREYGIKKTIKAVLEGRAI